MPTDTGPESTSKMITYKRHDSYYTKESARNYY